MKPENRLILERVVSTFAIAILAWGLWVTKGTTAERIDLGIRVAMQATETAEANHFELKRKHDLAIEFGFNPLLVEIVDHVSRKALIEPNIGDQFRLIQTHEYMTHIFLSLIYTESKGNATAKGDSGKAHGLTQIWLSTAKMYVPEITSGELMDPGTNVEVGFRHFRYLLTEYQGNFTLALLAWNRGEGRVDKIIAWGQSPVNGYGERVFMASVASSRLAMVTSIR